MEKALRLQEERAMRPGRGSHMHWYLSAAYSLVSIKRDPVRVHVFRRQAVDRVAKLLYKILHLQDPSDEYLANEVSTALINALLYQWNFFRTYSCKHWIEDIVGRARRQFHRSILSPEHVTESW